MPHRDHDELYLEHMLETAIRAADKVASLSRAEYDADENLRLALTHLVQTIGEAGRCVSEARRARIPEVPWREIVGMRHRLVHDYMRVDEDIIWEVCRGDLPDLVTALRRAGVSAPQPPPAGGDGPVSERTP